jgi:methanogenic corrinoid protein MtbC1
MAASRSDDLRELWTSAEVAHAFRVGVSSIKRWTDEGELDSVKTPGGHRRYTMRSLHHFATIRRLPADRLPPLPAEETLDPLVGITIMDALRAGDPALVRRLVVPPSGDPVRRATFFDRVIGTALRQVGEEWERGLLGVEEEHRASFLIAEALDGLRSGTVREGPLALLACPPGEWHDLPLRLVRLVTEESGWRTEFLGAHTPWSALRRSVDASQPAVVLLSARNPDPFQTAEFLKIVDELCERDIITGVGGEWARGGVGEKLPYLRFRTLRGFERWIRVRGNRVEKNVS